MFKERQFGVLEGKKNAWISARYAFNEGAIDKYDGVETMEELQQRANEALAYLRTLDHDTVLVVAHGAFGRALYRAVNDIPPTPKRIIRYKNAELVKLI